MNLNETVANFNEIVKNSQELNCKNKFVESE